MSNGREQTRPRDYAGVFSEEPNERVKMGNSETPRTTPQVFGVNRERRRLGCGSGHANCVAAGSIESYALRHGGNRCNRHPVVPCDGSQPFGASPGYSPRRCHPGCSPAPARAPDRRSRAPRIRPVRPSRPRRQLTWSSSTTRSAKRPEPDRSNGRRSWRDSPRNGPTRWPGPGSWHIGRVRVMQAAIRREHRLGIGTRLWRAQGRGVLVAEMKFYEPGRRSRSPRTSAQFKAGHDTQMVWKDTTAIGAGKATIQEGERKGWLVIVCNYDPPGNTAGKKPY